jgi:hypothetical protein
VRATESVARNGSGFGESAVVGSHGGFAVTVTSDPSDASVTIVFVAAVGVAATEFVPKDGCKRDVRAAPPLLLLQCFSSMPVDCTAAAVAVAGSGSVRSAVVNVGCVDGQVVVATATIPLFVKEARCRNGTARGNTGDTKSESSLSRASWRPLPSWRCISHESSAHGDDAPRKSDVFGRVPEIGFGFGLVLKLANRIGVDGKEFSFAMVVVESSCVTLALELLLVAFSLSIVGRNTCMAVVVVREWEVFGFVASVVDSSGCAC